MIVEVEAYGGPEGQPWPDAAAHSYRGIGGRNAVMFGPAGRLYTYRSHGIHVCANVVCATDDVAGAVLLRAVAIESGLDVARGRRGDSVRPAALGRGPGNLCSAMGITMEDNGIDLFDAKSPIQVMLGRKHDGCRRSARRREQGGRSALADVAGRASRGVALSPQPTGTGSR